MNVPGDRVHDLDPFTEAVIPLRGVGVEQSDSANDEVHFRLMDKAQILQGSSSEGTQRGMSINRVKSLDRHRFHFHDQHHHR